jgi:hypothetical protein
VEYYKFLGVTHVASLHVGDLYGQEFAKVFIEQAEKAGIDVFSVSFDLHDEQHAEDAVRQLKNSGRRYIFGMFYEVGALGPYISYHAYRCNPLCSLFRRVPLLISGQSR